MWSVITKGKYFIKALPLNVVNKEWHYNKLFKLQILSDK